VAGTRQVSNTGVAAPARPAGQPADSDATPSPLQHLAEANDRLSPSILVVLLEFDGTIRYANRAALEVIAASPDAILGRPFVPAPWWSACEHTRHRLAAAIAAGAVGAHSRFDVLISTAAGQTLTCDFSLDPVFDARPTKGYLVASVRDVTERRRADGALRVTRVAADLAPAPLFQVTAGGKIGYVNDAGSSLLGYTGEQLLGRTVHDIDDELRPAAWLRCWDRLKLYGTLRVRRSVQHRDGHSIPVVALANYIQHEGSEYAYIHVMDLGEQDAPQARIQRPAQYDALTGLPTRELLRNLLDIRIQSADAASLNIIVLAVGLERFALINDSLGQSAGDRVLMEVARRLRHCVGDASVVARLGSDEFAIILDEPTSPALAQVTRHLMDCLAPPMWVCGEELYVACSIGAARNRSTGLAADELISNARIALGDARQRGGRSVQTFTPRPRTRNLERLRLEADLHRAIQRAEFALHYQPRVDTQSGQVRSIEALLRWPRPGAGWMPPGRFIPIAEETGLINPIGAWALRTAMRESKRWSDHTRCAPGVSVNLSARQFCNQDLPGCVARMLDEVEMDPARLELELTESMLFGNIEEVIRKMRSLKQLGVRLSLDDFGTGYSSFSYMHRFPIDSLKIDKSFVHRIEENACGAAIVDTIITIAHRLNLSVTAEGVETEAQLAFLRERGCEEVQGYLIAAPMPSADLLSLLDLRRPLLHMAAGNSAIGEEARRDVRQSRSC
jgi:diguanylate cyclase (GGDEF)-like protein/PAS domain S-box-containing protein